MGRGDESGREPHLTYISGVVGEGNNRKIAFASMYYLPPKKYTHVHVHEQLNAVNTNKACSDGREQFGKFLQGVRGQT